MTSAATPGIAGTAALLLQQNPGQTPAQLQAKIESLGVDLGTAGKDNSFGFFKAGLTFSVPLGFIPEEYGSWSVAAGPAIYAFGTNLKAINEGNNPWVVGTASLNFSY